MIKYPIIMKYLQKILLIVILMSVTNSVAFAFGFGFGFKAGSKNNESIGRGVGNRSLFSLGPWHINNINGKLMIQGQFQSKTVSLKSDFSDEPMISAYTGNLSLTSSSVVWHPKFMTIDLDANYSPNALRQTYTISQNNFQTLTAESIRARVSILNQMPVNLVLTSSFGHGYTTRDNYSDFESYRRSHGAFFQYRNSVLPIFMSANTSQWEENELQTIRNSSNKRYNYNVNTIKEFSKYDKTSIKYSFEDYSRRLIVEPVGIRNKTTKIDFNNSIFFDSTKTNYLMSYARYYDLIGSYISKGINAYERLAVNLPEGFKISANYQFSREEQIQNKDIRNNIYGKLENQLYRSLNTFVNYSAQNINNTGYDEVTNTIGGGFRYNKLIPTGVLRLNYSISNFNTDRSSKAISKLYRKEEHVLDDSGLELLDNPYVNITSVIVYDPSLTIIYAEGIDYLLIPRGEYLEIQRLPGGMIGQGKTVLIDYESTKNLPYSYTSLDHNFGGSIILFDNFIEAYYSGIERNFSNIVNPRADVLKEVSQSVYGVKLNYDNISGGAEIDNLQSNIVPYRSTRVYVNYFDNLSNRLNLSLNASFKDTKLTDVNESYQSAAASAGANYQISKKARVKINSGYIFQRWEYGDINVFTLNGEITYKYLQIFLTLGIQYFDRNFYQEKINFQDVFLRIERRF